MKDQRRCTQEQRELYNDLPREHQLRWRAAGVGSTSNAQNGHSWPTTIRNVIAALALLGGGAGGTWYIGEAKKSEASEQYQRIPETVWTRLGNLETGLATTNARTSAQYDEILRRLDWLQRSVEQREGR